MGVVLLVCVVGQAIVAQLNLGASWRIGIEERARPGLVTSGLYRHPIFLAILMTLAGYTLLLPTLAEEEYLLRTHGDAYREYARGVGRFVPGVGRLILLGLLAVSLVAFAPIFYRKLAA